MDLNALNIFVNVVQAGSLSKASERMGIPTATISRQILGLEKQLNMQLFDRFKTGVKPTALGQELYQQTHLSLDNLLNAPQIILNNQQMLKGKLRIATTTAFEPIWTVIAEFQRQYPHIQVHCDASKRVLDLVEDNIDIACRLGEIHADNVIAKPIGEISMMLVSSPKLLAETGVPTSLADLEKLPCAGWANNDEMKLMWQFGAEQIKPQTHLTSNDMPMLAHYAEQGLAICLLPDYLGKRLILEKNLQEVLPDLPKPTQKISLVYASHRYPSAIVRAFLDFAKK